MFKNKVLRRKFGYKANVVREEHRKLQFIQKNPTRCNNVSKFYYSIFI